MNFRVSHSIRHLLIKKFEEKAMDLKEVVCLLEKFAPLHLAEKWDNVGLLIEPYKSKPIKKIILTNDLTEQVLEEAVQMQANMVISYHPPIFVPLKRITNNHWKERIVGRMLSESIALYSPHTAWDAVQGGVNDWLISSVKAVDITPIIINQNSINGFEGNGRFGYINLTIEEAINAVRKHIKLNTIQLTMGVRSNMQTKLTSVAVCAGSGQSVLSGVPADLYITGEMSHHDLLDCQQKNITVIICNHSNSERGFLQQFQLSKILNSKCDIYMAKNDADPLQTVYQQ